MMNDQLGKELLKKYVEGIASEQEILVVENWYAKEALLSTQDPAHLDYKRVKQEIWNSIDISEDFVVRKARNWRPYYAAAAVAFVVLSLALLFFRTDSTERKLIRDTSHAIHPGRAGATLTLASGKQIKLTDVSNGELAKEAGVVIKKSKNGELVYEVISGSKESHNLNTLSTANGQTYQIHLPDGTLVHLNAASSLTYRTDLIEHGKRIVKLSGEGYFEVARDAAHPFLVKTKGQEVEVLGTHFNINAYDNEAVSKTTLLEGSVKVNNELFLRPGQQAIAKGSKLSMQRADVDEAVAWKNGEFFFDQENFVATMNMIARWYDVEIVYDYQPVGLRLAGEISRARGINEVLQILQSTGEVKFKIEGRRIRVIK